MALIKNILADCVLFRHLRLLLKQISFITFIQDAYPVGEFHRRHVFGHVNTGEAVPSPLFSQAAQNPCRLIWRAGGQCLVDEEQGGWVGERPCHNNSVKRVEKRKRLAELVCTYVAHMATKMPGKKNEMRERKEGRSKKKKKR